MFYSSEPEALRAFIRDKLDFVSWTDVGEGWLIFDVPEADMGCHPADEEGTQGRPAGTHDVSFYCDDLEQTVQALKDRGVTFTMPIEDQGFGLVTRFEMPGGVSAQLYQPHYSK
tara:strand:- start:808 stop:1149 length:342 start_codon:yes stop_codon:yes gene_type:complete